MRNQAVILLFVFMLAGSVFGGTYSGGDGSAYFPYIIADFDDLMELAATSSDYDAYFLMIADIDLDPCLPGRHIYDISLIAGSGLPAFSGVLDGAGHKISNLKIDRRSEAGLFGAIAADGKVKNLLLEGGDFKVSHDVIGSLVATNNGYLFNCYSTCYVAGLNNVGGLVGINNGVISNCYVLCSVDGSDSVGALAGLNTGTIENCYAMGSAEEESVAAIVTGENKAGGIAGNNDGGTIIACYSTVEVLGKEASNDVGGIVGYNGSGLVQGCFTMSAVTGDNNIGGVLGNNDGQLSLCSCHATETITGKNNVGGIIGYNTSENVSGCYATASVAGRCNVGGMIGNNHNDGNLDNCYVTGDVNGFDDSNNIGGLIGYNENFVVSNCNCDGEVNAGVDSKAIGGLIGYNRYAVIENCYTDMQVTGSENVGGLIGQNEGGRLTKCRSIGKVTGQDNVGGLIGKNKSRISDNYSLCAVVGDTAVGGLVGLFDSGTMTNCYSAGLVEGNVDVGGLVGVNQVDLQKSFWDLQSSTMLSGVGNNTGQADIQGKTTSQMKMAADFIAADWDFMNTWDIGLARTYPYFRRKPSADINEDGSVDYADLGSFADSWLK